MAGDDERLSNGAAAHLSPLAAWALAFGCAVGWGSFIMPGTTFLPKAGPLGTLLGILAGGAVMAVVAWNYHVMMRRHPGPGGAYAYAKEAFGVDHGFLCAWFLGLAYMAIVWANATALAIAARCTLGDVFRFGFTYSVVGFEVCLGDVLVAAAAVAAAAAVCCRRRVASRVQTVFAVGFGLGVSLCFAGMLLKHGGGFRAMAPAFSPGAGAPLHQTLRIVALSPWLFIGFEGISHSSGEFAFPLRRSFRVLVLSILASVAAYAMLAALPAVAPAGDGTVWTDFLGGLQNENGALSFPVFASVSRAFGHTGVVLLGCTMFGAIFTGLVGNIFATSRLFTAMAHDGVLPERFGRLNADGSPQFAVLAIGAAIAYAYVSAAVWRLSHGPGSALNRATGIGGVILSAFIMLLFIVPNYADGSMMATESYLVLVLWCIFGFFVFRSVSRRDRTGRFGRSVVVWVVILIVIALMSLMWMRQSAVDATARFSGEMAALHDRTFPGEAPETTDHWHKSIALLVSDMNAELMRDGLVQTGLLGIAIAIMFNLYGILRRRERELAQENARRQRENEVEREKSKARSFFFSTVSHDIRTPLNAIIGYSEMLKAGFESAEEREKAVDSIIVSGKTLLGLVNDVLDLSKLESGKMEILPEPTDCAALLGKIVDSFHAAGDRPGLELRLRAREMPRLMVDPQRLRQVVFNLVGNAMKFTERGFVEVRASFTPFTPDSPAPAEAGDADGTFRLEVEDTGCGIAPENLARIASPYVQVGSKVSRHGGTGLGLAICKQLAAAVGGTLAVASELGRGSTFTIEVPVRRAPETGAPEEAAEAGESAREGMVFGDEAAGGAAAPVGRVSRILVVDDSKMNLAVLKALLGRVGDYEVETALDGDLALERLRKPDAPGFDLVLTDMWMRRLDGEGLVREIRADPALSSLKVFAVTADVEFREKAVAAGFDGMLLKPVTMAVLRSILK